VPTPEPATPAPATPTPAAAEVYAPQVVVDARFANRVQPDYPDTVCNGLWEYRPDFSRDLWKRGAKITQEAAGSVLVLDNGEGLQSQGKSLDLSFENLFETLTGMTHDTTRGEIRCARLATARAYSRQTSWGASWT